MGDGDRVRGRLAREDVEKPRRDRAEVHRVECVQTLATMLLDADHVGSDELLQMSRGRRPRMTESVGELARGHGATASMKCHEDVAPVLIGERGEDRVELVELAKAPRPRLQRVSRVEKCGKAMPGPIARVSTSVSIRSQIAPTCGCCAARRDPSASSH